jgi:hypothetical protein
MPDLTVDVAREVVKIAIARNAYSWDGGIDRSGDEVEVVQIATDLIERATTALNKGIKNPNIDAILEAAGSAPTNGHVEQTSPAPAPFQGAGLLQSRWLCGARQGGGAGGWGGRRHRVDLSRL